MSVVAAVAAAGGSSVLFGIASARQHHLVSAGQARGSLDPGLLVSLLRNGAWLLAGGLDLVAVGLQLLALRWGAVSLVQPLLVLGLPLAVLIAARLKHQRITPTEWAGIALCGAGVTALAILLPGSASHHDHPGVGTLVVLAVGLVVATGAAVPGQPALTGAAAGLAAGIGSVALALSSERIGDPAALLASWPPYVAVVAGVLALQLGQAAFQGDRLGAPLAAATLLEPLAAVVLATALLHEQLASGTASRVGAVVATVAAGAGVVLVARHAPSPS